MYLGWVLPGTYQSDTLGLNDVIYTNRVNEQYGTDLFGNKACMGKIDGIAFTNGDPQENIIYLTACEYHEEPRNVNVDICPTNINPQGDATYECNLEQGASYPSANLYTSSSVVPLSTTWGVEFSTTNTYYCLSNIENTVYDACQYIIYQGSIPESSTVCPNTITGACFYSSDTNLPTNKRYTYSSQIDASFANDSPTSWIQNHAEVITDPNFSPSPVACFDGVSQYFYACLYIEHNGGSVYECPTDFDSGIFKCARDSDNQIDATAIPN